MLFSWNSGVWIAGRALNGCLTGESKITSGYNLPAFVCVLSPFSRGSSCTSYHDGQGSRYSYCRANLLLEGQSRESWTAGVELQNELGIGCREWDQTHCTLVLYFCVPPLRLLELLARHSLRYPLASTHTQLLMRPALLLTRLDRFSNRRTGARWVGFWYCSKGASYVELVCLSSWKGWYSWSGATKIRESMSKCIVLGSGFLTAQAIYNHRELIPEYFPPGEEPQPAEQSEPVSTEPDVQNDVQTVED